MPKTKSRLPAPRIVWWKNEKGEFNYHIIGENGKVIGGHNQGFKRMDGLIKNIVAVAAVFGVKIHLLVDPLARKTGNGTFSADYVDFYIPLFKIIDPT